MCCAPRVQGLNEATSHNFDFACFLVDNGDGGIQFCICLRVPLLPEDPPGIGCIRLRNKEGPELGLLVCS